MEDSKKNKERKVLTDEELEQVSGGRLSDSAHSQKSEDPCAQWKDRGTCDEKYDCNCIWDWGKNKCISFIPQE